MDHRLEYPLQVAVGREVARADSDQGIGRPVAHDAHRLGELAGEAGPVGDARLAGGRVVVELRLQHHQHWPIDADRTAEAPQAGVPIFTLRQHALAADAVAEEVVHDDRYGAFVDHALQLVARAPVPPPVPRQPDLEEIGGQVVGARFGQPAQVRLERVALDAVADPRQQPHRRTRQRSGLRRHIVAAGFASRPRAGEPQQQAEPGRNSLPCRPHGLFLEAPRSP